MGVAGVSEVFRLATCTGRAFSRQMRAHPPALSPASGSHAVHAIATFLPDAPMLCGKRPVPCACAVMLAAA